MWSKRSLPPLQHKPFLPTTGSCGCASWAQPHFGRVIARRRHSELYVASVNGNVSITLCPFFCPHTHVFFNTPAVHCITCGLRDQVESAVADCRNILPLSAGLPRGVGRSSLQRMTISEFPQSLCVSFHVHPFFLRALWMLRGREQQCACMSLSSANDDEQEAHTKRTAFLRHVRRRVVGRWKLVCLTPQHDSSLFLHQLMSSHGTNGTSAAKQSPDLVHDSSPRTKRLSREREC